MSTLSAGYIPVTDHSCFAVVHTPPPSVAPRHVIVHVPAFGEEMNKSRHMISRQARLFADQGALVLIPDLCGTGDSDRELAACDWHGWKLQVAAIMDWAARESGLRVSLWGLRLGCLLALDVLQDPAVRTHSLLLWQPVHSGKQFMGQFLRLRTAAAMMRGEEASAASLRQQLLDEGSLDVAGYSLPLALYEQLDALMLSRLTVPAGTTVHCIEVTNGEPGVVMPVTERCLEAWREQGIECNAGSVSGDTFWLTQELGFSPDLLAASLDWSGQLEADPGGEGAQPSARLPLLGEHPHGDCTALVFPCGTDELLGLLQRSTAPEAQPRGVLIVVGGPQYRVGSHRQFVELAQTFSAGEVPVFRFDYRGMGDSGGTLQGFDGVGEDIRSAVDAFFDACPGMEEITLWGLCDGATASAFYAAADPRVTGLILANPWVHSEAGAAQAYLKHYYLKRIFSKGLWSKVLRGGFKPRQSLQSLFGMLSQASSKASTEAQQPEAAFDTESSPQARARRIQGQGNLAARLGESLLGFKGAVLLLLSGDDLTAAQFRDAAKAGGKLGAAMDAEQVETVVLEGADHTFSDRHWADQCEQASLQWVQRRSAQATHRP